MTRWTSYWTSYLLRRFSSSFSSFIRGGPQCRSLWALLVFSEFTSHSVVCLGVLTLSSLSCESGWSWPNSCSSALVPHPRRPARGVWRSGHNSLGVDQCQFPDQCQSKFIFLSPFEPKIGSKNEILVIVNLPLFSVSFYTLCNKKLACPRNYAAIFRSIHREMICARCAAFQCAKSCIDSFF